MYNLEKTIHKYIKVCYNIRVTLTKGTTMALNRRSSVSTTAASSEVEYTNLKEGEYEGRLVYVADLGLQEREYMGESKPPATQISLGIEILGETAMVDGKEQPRLLWTRPFNIFYEMNEKGNEYKYYKVFEPSAKEGQVADWDSVLGKPCNVLVKNVAGKGENASRLYDNIDSISPIPAKYQADVSPSTITDQAVGDADDENNPAQRAMFGLPRYIFDRRIKGGNNKAEAKAVESSEDFDDAIPF